MQIHAGTESRLKLQRAYANALGLLAFAFFLRVSGQVLVAIFQVDFLPPMAEWTSGLLPYSVLLPIQVLIVVVQVMICAHIWRDAGYFAICRPRTGILLRRLSYVYFTVTALRYTLMMSLHPERRWLLGTIPIFFHFVLGAYVYTLGRFYVRAQRGVSSAELTLRSVQP